MHRDRRYCAERGAPRRYAVWNRRAEVRRYGHDLSVMCMAAACACNQVARANAGHVAPDLDDTASRAITNRGLLGELALDRLASLCETLAPRRFNHVLHEIRARFCLAD